jgi:hypothetical protein
MTATHIASVFLQKDRHLEATESICELRTFKPVLSSWSANWILSPTYVSSRSYSKQVEADRSFAPTFCEHIETYLPEKTANHHG